jgi:dTDP-4-dehydrorhamnose 3,5-epimerase
MVRHSANASGDPDLTANFVPALGGVRFSKLNSSSDLRGSFRKFFPFAEFENSFDSVSVSYNPQIGTLRGLHFQVEPFAEEKLVTCIKGSVFDVLVDLRPNSPTLGKWTSFELSYENRLQVYLPKGIAHGFQSTSVDSIVHYCLSSSFSPEFSYALDPLGDIDIDWPLKISLISVRDSEAITLKEAIQRYAEALKA